MQPPVRMPGGPADGGKPHASAPSAGIRVRLGEIGEFGEIGEIDGNPATTGPRMEASSPAMVTHEFFDGINGIWWIGRELQ